MPGTQALRRAVDALLREKHGVGLDEWLRAADEEGHGYEAIARRLYMATGGSVEISYQTAKRWLRDARTDEAA